MGPPPWAERVKEAQAAALRLCPPDVARNMRFAHPEVRLHYVRVRAEGADALDVGTLARMMHDCLIFAADGAEGGAAVDIYVPLTRPVLSRALRAAARFSMLLSALAAALAAWTLAAALS